MNQGVTQPQLLTAARRSGTHLVLRERAGNNGEHSAGLRQSLFLLLGVGSSILGGTLVGFWDAGSFSVLSSVQHRVLLLSGFTL